MRSLAGVPLLVCHSAYWAAAYGRDAAKFKDALEGGILMASTRFRMGDDFDEIDYEENRNIPVRRSSIEFCKKLTQIAKGTPLLCLPGFDMDYLSRPVTIGLGDAFIGGFLPGLLDETDRLYAKGGGL